MPPAPAAIAGPDRAVRLLDIFHDRFGHPHEIFACHAAYPAALTPELAYQLWAAFRADIHGRPLGVPWIAVPDLLLSPLCAEIGDELYEMAPYVRSRLRRRLLDDPSLGPRRVAELSELLLDIAATGLHAEDRYERTLAEAQRLSALAYSSPERAATLLAEMLRALPAHEHAGWVRLASLVRGLAEPLAAYPLLVQLAPAMVAFGLGKNGPIQAYLAEHGAAAGAMVERAVVSAALAAADERGEAPVEVSADAPVEESPRAVLDARLDGYARKYEEHRRTMPRSRQRTKLLDKLVDDVRKVIKDAGITHRDLQARFDIGGDGDRIVALAGALAKPSTASFDMMRLAVEVPRSSFEQFWGLQVALRIMRQLDRGSQEALRAALQHQLSGVPGTRLQREHVVYSRGVAGEILRYLDEALGDERAPQLLDMVRIPAGRFWMGSDREEPMSTAHERPRHEVELSAFEIARVPVTQSQYRRVMGENPSSKKNEDWPVIDVSWVDAVRFCNALSRRERLAPAYQIDGFDVEWDPTAGGYRLPTEAEWEYAARGTDGRMYPWGNERPSNQLCWNGGGNDLGGTDERAPCPVGSYPRGATPFGVLDMAGNVWEWCWDWYDRYPDRTAAVRDPSGPQGGSKRIVRGGSRINTEPSYVRAVDRSWLSPSRRLSLVGFRCARGTIVRQPLWA